MKEQSARAAPASSFLGKAGPLVLARLFTAGLTVSIPLVLARVLALEEYGTYYQLFLIATTLYMVLPFGVVQSLYYFLPRAEEKRPWLGQTLFFMSGAAVGATGARRRAIRTAAAGRSAAGRAGAPPSTTRPPAAARTRAARPAASRAPWA